MKKMMTAEEFFKHDDCMNNEVYSPQNIDDWFFSKGDMILFASKYNKEIQPDQLMQFFLWFRLNGEKHQGESIEIMIKTYLKKSIKNE